MHTGKYLEEKRMGRSEGWGWTLIAVEKSQSTSLALLPTKAIIVLDGQKYEYGGRKYRSHICIYLGGVGIYSSTDGRRCSQTGVQYMDYLSLRFV